MLVIIGAPGEIRTPDTQVRSLVLYPAELRARVIRAVELSNSFRKRKDLLNCEKRNVLLNFTERIPIT